ncbi:MAG: amidohydrolase family protein [Eubacteriales bacterium]|nr:amidohydrolase family protein [Eubacteriales bacterium]
MKTCFKNIRFIDGTGKDLRKNIQILVNDGIIQAIDEGASDDCPEDYLMIDMDNRYVIPGMIDCHTHIFLDAGVDFEIKNLTNTPVDDLVTAIQNLEKQIRSGVVFIRDVGGKHHYDIHLKKHIEKGTITGPDMYCAGKIVTMTGGHGHQIGREADGIDEVRKAVREQLKAGADVIKVISTGGVMTPGVDINAYQFNIEELKAAVEEAHKAGKKVCTHCHGTQGIKNSVVAGIDSIEHSSLLDEEAADMMASAGTYMVPTLSAPHNIIRYGEQSGIPKFVVEKTIEIGKRCYESFNLARKAGVSIAMGTDAGTPFNEHGSSAQELVLMVEAGMSPMEAIVTASKNSSELIGIDHLYGTLEIGKFANFIVLDDNPLDNIKSMRNPFAVYKKGVCI